MQVSMGLPGVAPVGKSGYCLPQDYILSGDSNEAATLMAKLLVDTYVPTIFPADATEKTPAVGIIQASQVDKQALPDTATTALSPYAAVASPAVQVDADSCCLEDCDRILDNLYLGGVEAVLDSKCLEEQGICAVVCCNRELEFPTSKFLPDLEYYRVDVEDMGREPIELFFAEATEFIQQQLLQDRPVLVHCKAGVSRSASVVLAYLMEYRGYSLHDAFLLTLDLRPTITPNPGFMEQLRRYEKEVCGLNVASIDIHKYVGWFQAEKRCPAPDLRPD
jgi:dual specificity phosphatase 12